jgi:hypothetical protein
MVRGRPGPQAAPVTVAQGTIYPDVIESAGSKSGKAHVIKSHHNMGHLSSAMTWIGVRHASRACVVALFEQRNA